MSPRGRWGERDRDRRGARARAGVRASRDREVRRLARRSSAAIGYDVRFGDMSLGWSHATFTDVHVRKNGDPVLDAGPHRRRLRAARHLPGRQAPLRLRRPRGRRGRRSRSCATPTARTTSTAAARHRRRRQSTQAAAEPLLFSARVRDGTIQLVDQAPLEPDLARAVDRGRLDRCVGAIERAHRRARRRHADRPALAEPRRSSAGR